MTVADDLDVEGLLVQRRRVGNRLLAAFGGALVVQVGVWELIDTGVAAGSVIVGAYAAPLLLAGAWLPMPRDGFSWRGWFRRNDQALACDRLYWAMVLGGFLGLQLAQMWLREQGLGYAIIAVIVLSPSLLMLVVIELRRRARRRRAHARDVAVTEDAADEA